MKFKNILLLILPLSLLNVSSCSNNPIQEDVLTAKKLVVQADDVISYIPLNSEYLPGESVTFQITSSKLSTQEFKVYLNDEELTTVKNKKDRAEQVYDFESNLGEFGKYKFRVKAKSSKATESNLSQEVVYIYFYLSHLQ